MSPAALFTLSDTVKVRDIVDGEDEVLPTNSCWKTVGNVVGVPLVGIFTKDSSRCSLEIGQLVVETVMDL